MTTAIRREWRTEDGSVRLLLGDAQLIVPQLADHFDCIIADIPYGKVNRESGGLRNLDKGEADIETFPIQFVVDQCSRLAETSYIWCGTEQVSELRAGFVEGGMTTRLCGWEKTNPSPMNGERLWLSSFECCVFARKPNAYFGKHCESPIWRGPIQRDQIHPTQKPLWLIDIAVSASVPHEGSVLDFCCGSGTTLVSAYHSWRSAVGIERDERHWETARQRLMREVRRTSQFDKQVQSQKSMFDGDAA